MSANSIPNLLSLRENKNPRSGSARTGLRGLGRDKGSDSQTVERTPTSTQDRIVQGTDDDAAVSRLSAVDLGYLDDPFAQHFIETPSGGGRPSPRRLPIINRGTYTRTRALDHLIDSFLAQQAPLAASTCGDDQGAKTAAEVPQIQIISLGAGTDTRIFRLFSRRAFPGLVYHELDFPAIARKKAHIIQATPTLKQLLGDLSLADDGSWACQLLTGVQYHCHALDLRHLVTDASLSSVRGLNVDLPTLLLSECCLCYLEPSTAKGVIQRFTDHIPNLAVVIYEPVKPYDAFGRMMVSNLAARKLRMPTLECYPLPIDQQTRLLEAGLTQAKTMTIDEIWECWISQDEKRRIDAIERLDEIEEWQLLAGHYIVAWGWKGQITSL
ncbi:leucine carboxyl methyltransferase [Sodiomyces alkalinus F11]|uniref:Leucine carboxyl methyltransferase 1 n=1 Tax=Sodiomyces alkalinus (strain CBS 110278 / VKM F-3762 / F11) TaxID=1314773 RepID=A0A3N2PKH7_SODAK|nr:leucine carboxyl methyltransferase [Sodiomyces alkalinus F11]ROT34826.1 leucine carboxyl methyltransferase [Sodiomyces alkalinus F11]